jgi:hypothetical protein
MLKLVSDALAKNTVVVQLMLHNNSITDMGVKYLVKNIKRHPILHTIWLGGNRLTDEGVFFLCELLKKNNKIKDLNISNKWPELTWNATEHDTHPRVTEKGASMLASVLAVPGLCGLLSLCLAQQRVGDIGASRLLEACALGNLRSLNLRDNNISDEFADGLLRLLSSKRSHLEHLDLSHNKIGDRTIAIIAPSLPRNRILHALNLSYNKIGENGMKALLLDLHLNQALTTLNVGNNACSDITAERFIAERNVMRMVKHVEAVDDAVDVESDLDDDESNDRFDFAPSSQTPKRSSEKARKHTLKIIDALTSDVGAFGRRLPTRGLRADSPGGINPFSKNRENVGSLPHTPVPADKHRILVHSASVGVHTYDESTIQDLKIATESPKRSAGSNREYIRTESSMNWDFLRMPSSISYSSIGIDEDGSSRGSSALHSEESTPRNDTAADNVASNGNDLSRAQTAVPADIRTSSKLGKTLGIPYIGSYVGNNPVRTSVSRHGDSAEHLMYLKVLTPADEPGTAPYSLLKVRSHHVI